MEQDPLAPAPALPAPTCTRRTVDHELARWSRIYAGPEYYYGLEPGPVARRAVRYHRGFRPHGGRALDAGCGEGQDLAFLAERGYHPLGVEFTAEGAEKARQFLQERRQAGEVVQADLRDYLGLAGSPAAPETFDLVLAVNTLQFLGEDAPAALEAMMDRVAPGGVIGVSLFGREPGEPAVVGTVAFMPFEELLRRFEGWQKLEAARLWQWNVATDEPQAFVQMIARKAPAARHLARLR